MARQSGLARKTKDMVSISRVYSKCHSRVKVLPEPVRSSTTLGQNCNLRYSSQQEHLRAQLAQDQWLRRSAEPYGSSALKSMNAYGHDSFLR